MENAAHPHCSKVRKEKRKTPEIRVRLASWSWQGNIHRALGF